ncbi:PAS domain S-box protein, partial [Acinetobacter baumannii]
KKTLDFIVAEDITMTTRAANKVIRGKGISNFENRYKHKNGTVVNMSWSATWDQNTKYMYVIGRDITEMKKREQERISLIEELTESNKD